jgi:hypothetical protein
LKSDLPALKLFLEEIEGAVRVKHLKELFWVEAIICGVTVAMAFCGNWGVFAGLAFMSMIVPIWVIALGVWGSVRSGGFRSDVRKWLQGGPERWAERCP